MNRKLVSTALAAAMVCSMGAASATTVSAEEQKTVGILMPTQSSERWINDGANMKKQLEEKGYKVELQYAEDDTAMQVSQLENYVGKGVDCLVIAAIDSGVLVNAEAQAKEAGIPIIAYDRLLMDTDAVSYYATFDNKGVGTVIGNYIKDTKDLDAAREAGESYTIEFFMGSPDDNNALFLYNGIMEVLQEYLDDGTLVCKSGNTSFDDTGIMRWSETSAKTKLDSIISEFYAEEKAPDIICTAYDGFAYAAEEILSDSGLEPGSDEWPMITGYGSEAQAVKDIAAGKMSFTMFMDRKELAKGGAQMAIDYLTGEKVDVKDYSQYDNGVKIVGTFTCGAQMIDKDNYQILVDNGTYTEDEIAPDPTPAPEATPVPKVTLKTASEEDSKEVTPTPETEDKSEGETRENLIYDSEDNSKVEKTSDQKK